MGCKNLFLLGGFFLLSILLISVVSAFCTYGDKANINNEFVQGHVTVPGWFFGVGTQEHEDSCANFYKGVDEWTCVGSGDTAYPKFTYKPCPEGCRQGACVDVCKDSDAFEYDNAGQVTYIETDGRKTIKKDKCTWWDTKVIEYYCKSHTAWGWVERSCENGCEAGACLKAPTVPATTTPTTTTTTTTTTCKDTDKGRVYETKGNTTQGSTTFHDHCLNGLLNEGYCLSGKLKSESVSCGTGKKCYGGKCIADTPTTTCSDSDVTSQYADGKNYYAGGITTKGAESKSDSCKDGLTRDTLTEYYCKNGEIKSESHTCSWSEQCVNNACRDETLPEITSEIKCGNEVCDSIEKIIKEGEEITLNGNSINIGYVDPDEVVFYVNGIRTYIKFGDSSVSLSGGALIEVLKIEKKMVLGNIGEVTFRFNETISSCSQDCLDNNLIIAGEKYICTDTDGGKKKFIFGKTSNEIESKKDTCIIDNGKVKLKEYYCNSNGEVKDKNFNCASGLCDKKKGICIPRTCGDYSYSRCPLGKKVAENGDECARNKITRKCIVDGEVKSEYKCDDKIDNDKDGKIDCLDSDCAGKTCGTGKVCSNSKCIVDTPSAESKCYDNTDDDGDGKIDCLDSDCAGKSCGVNSICISEVCTASVPAIPSSSCSDSDVTSQYADGKNYYLGGITTKGTESESDSCEDGLTRDTLTEYYCENDVIKSESYTCSWSEQCVNNACRDETLPETPVCSKTGITCTDKDGDHKDACVPKIGLLREYSCTTVGDSKLCRHTDKNCVAGKECSEGLCVDEVVEEEVIIEIEEKNCPNTVCASEEISILVGEIYRIKIGSSSHKLQIHTWGSVSNNMKIIVDDIKYDVVKGGWGDFGIGAGLPIYIKETSPPLLIVGPENLFNCRDCNPHLVSDNLCEACSAGFFNVCTADDCESAGDCSYTETLSIPFLGLQDGICEPNK